MRRWAWAAVVVLLGPQLVLLGGVGARREAQRTQQPGQRADPPNATASASSREGLPEAPKPSQASGPEFSDAHMTWLNFVRRPDDGALRKRCGSRDKKPRDLFGPPGPPGAEVTTETLLHEFQELLKEAKERRFSGLLDLLLPQGAGLRLVGEAFHCRLQGPRRVDKRTLVELHGFQAPAAQGAFLRGSGLSLASGRFTAPVSGIFQFSASLHVDHSELQGKARLRARDVVRVLICIESLCQRHTCLEAVSGLESNSRVFTVQVQGLLQLQAGQYASVFVDNGSGAVLTIQAGSSFSGLLLGT
ncbi:adipolin [Gorilla gorilla gorilla]|uniref:Adipolin n=1 Tax=Gorilla gorilla gorilla TaxID=9595 RepID=G3QT42_GORGO